MGALSFTSPLILAALASLPIVWWLLRATPPSPQEQHFPAFIILRQLTNKQETPDRTPWWLLLMRLLLVTFAIFALAGPILNAPPKTPASGPIALVVDNTYTAAHHWRARKDALLTAAAEAESADRTIYIVETAQRDEPAPLQPMTGEAAREIAESMAPQPFSADRAATIEQLSPLEDITDLEIRWLTDGLAGDSDNRFAEALTDLGALSVFNDSRSPKPALRALGGDSTGPLFQIERLSGEGEWAGTLVATAQDGRELARQSATVADGETKAEVRIELPLALRNEIASVRIENASSAGAVQLIDARDRRALVGLIAESVSASDRLLTGTHYLREALSRHAEIIEDNLRNVMDAGVSVIILDDIGAIRSSEIDTLTAWIESGGVLIRFAGPILAEAAQDRDPPLLPVPLRGGGRAFGGALTWDTPQTIDAFPATSPFAGIEPPEDALIRRQVLAQPGGETTTRSWARLKDGTPLVTGQAMGDGAIALFHITATPQWSDLPLSGVFVDMLRRLVFLSALGPEGQQANEETRYPPLRLLNGYGRFEKPTDTNEALTASMLAEPAGPQRRAGLYGAPDAPLALNVISERTDYSPLSLSGQRVQPYEAVPPQRLAPPLFAAAFVLLLLDAIATLALSGKLRLRTLGATAVFAFATIALSFSLTTQSIAQPVDAPIEESSKDAALLTRLAYVKTGDRALDRLSAQALAGLSRELYRRTALEPGVPVGLNPETDDLSVYPFLYWPIAPGVETPSERALDNIENFMRLGGLILFDTRDDERAVGSTTTPEAQALQNILLQLNIPPLTPVTGEHVLTRSFYLLSDGLYGRLRNNPVWVAAESTGANDGVTPVIIGGRDWAGAWAVDSLGRPVRPMGQGGPRAREYAYRAGINIVMVAFTGNYKSDQVHTPILLQRLGQ